jgi:hypothetical protein
MMPTPRFGATQSVVVRLRSGIMQRLRGLPLALVLVAALLSGCGNPIGSAQSRSTHSVWLTRSAPSTDCTVYEAGAAVNVTWSGPDAQALCDDFIRQASSSSAYWRQQATQGVGQQVVCSLAKDAWTVTVKDWGGLIQGQGICGNLASQGWTDTGAASPPTETVPTPSGPPQPPDADPNGPNVACENFACHQAGQEVAHPNEGESCGGGRSWQYIGSDPKTEAGLYGCR